LRLSWYIVVYVILAPGMWTRTAIAQQSQRQGSQQSAQDEDTGSNQSQAQAQAQAQQGAKVDDQGSAQSQGEEVPTARVKERKRRQPRQPEQALPKSVEGNEPSRSTVPQATANPVKVRRFHEVLDELLAEFGYDVKSGQIKGLSNVSIRKVRVSQAIPKSYEDYIETLLAERIREQSQVKIISCIPCKTKTSSLVEGKLMISSPSTNLAKLDAAATSLGIDNFLDAVLVYHTTHMVLAIDIFDTKSKELVWARTYNSETVKSRYQKLAVDYSQVAKSRPTDEYVPEYRFLLGLGGGQLPNVGGTTEDKTMVHLHVRATEKFNNRKDEFGLLLALHRTTKSLLKAYPTTAGKTSNPDESTSTATPESSEAGKPKPFSTAIGLYGLYSHVFLGSVESYDRLRHGVYLGLGGVFTTGYIAPGARLGWDLHLGRRFVTTFTASYVGSTSIVVDSNTTKVSGGAGGDITLSVNL
jgi:hypothetical protein